MFLMFMASSRIASLSASRFKISSRDYTILNTRRKTAAQIADTLELTRKSRDGETDTMTEWTVRTARKRAKDKIKSLFNVKPDYKEEYERKLKNIRRQIVT